VITSPAEPAELADGALESQESVAMDVVRSRPHRDFDDVVGPGEVERALNTARSHFDGSRIRAFVPILVERLAVDDLRLAAAREQPPSPDDR
jgi:hypothetical protein